MNKIQVKQKKKKISPTELVEPDFEINFFSKNKNFTFSTGKSFFSSIAMRKQIMWI